MPCFVLVLCYWLVHSRQCVVHSGEVVEVMQGQMRPLVLQRTTRRRAHLLHLLLLLRQ